tara:strand:- start:194 stop:382 length:189 start_codon:yes stop_codon:yes gene_type:complete
MNRIEPHAQVVVMTGYPDCQLHYQGFKAEVISEEGSGYRVRDLKGREYHCEASELILDTDPH